MYFDTDLTYFVTTANLATRESLRHTPDYRGRFTFALDEEGLEGVTIQITRKGKLNIYYPSTSPQEPILIKILQILSEANQKQVKILRAKVPDTSASEGADSATHAEIGKLYLNLKSIERNASTASERAKYEVIRDILVKLGEDPKIAIDNWEGLYNIEYGKEPNVDELFEYVIQDIGLPSEVTEEMERIESLGESPSDNKKHTKNADNP